MVNAGNKPKYIAVAELAKMLGISRVAESNAKLKDSTLDAIATFFSAYLIELKH